LVLRSDLTKMAIELGEDCPYSSEDIYRFTESAESFNKAASEEAQFVWAGLSDELRKAGADQDFLDGMVKEALTGLPIRAMVGNPVKALQTAFNVIRSGGGAATTEALNMAKNSPEAMGLFDRAGNAITGEPIKNLTGARRLAYADELEKAITPAGKALPDSVIDSLDAARASNIGKIKTQLDTGAEEAVQNHLSDLQRAAKGRPGMALTPQQIAAQGKVNEIAAGRYGAIGRKLNVPVSDLKDRLPEVLSDAKSWAGEAVGAKHNYGNVTPYSNFMNKKDPSFMGVKFRPVTGFNRAMAGGAAGTLLGMPFGVAPITGAIGTGLGAATGLFGTAPVLAAGALGTAGLTGTAGYLGYKGVKGVANNLGLGGQDTQTKDQSGELQDRHRVVPFMNNRATGAIGGALLAALIANHSGMNGPMSWLLPILGGVAGYHYLPQMMNKWKDPYGVGENAINPLAAGINQQYPPGQ